MTLSVDWKRLWEGTCVKRPVGYALKGEFEPLLESRVREYQNKSGVSWRRLPMIEHLKRRDFEQKFPREKEVSTIWSVGWNEIDD
jgi:hypothetical protein